MTETAVQVYDFKGNDVKIGDPVGINGAKVLNLPNSDKYKSLYWSTTMSKCDELLGKGNNNTLFLSSLLGLSDEFMAEICVGMHSDIPNFDYVFTSYESTDKLEEYYDFNDYGLYLIFDELSLSDYSTETTEKILEDKYTLIFEWSLRDVFLAKSWDEWNNNHPSTDKDYFGYVYIIQQIGMDDYYKIGKTKNIDSRLSNLKTGSPTGYTVTNSGYVKNMDKCESFLHDKYSNKRVQGGWFSLSDKDLKDIDKFLHNNN